MGLRAMGLGGIGMQQLHMSCPRGPTYLGQIRFDSYSNQPAAGLIHIHSLLPNFEGLDLCPSLSRPHSILLLLLVSIPSLVYHVNSQYPPFFPIPSSSPSVRLPTAHVTPSTSTARPPPRFSSSGDSSLAHLQSLTPDRPVEAT